MSHTAIFMAKQKRYCKGGMKENTLYSTSCTLAPPRRQGLTLLLFSCGQGFLMFTVYLHPGIGGV